MTNSNNINDDSRRHNGVARNVPGNARDNNAREIAARDKNIQESINARPVTPSEVAYRDGYVQGRAQEHLRTSTSEEVIRRFVSNAGRLGRIGLLFSDPTQGNDPNCCSQRFP
jgi:hypothetical protein